MLTCAPRVLTGAQGPQIFDPGGPMSTSSTYWTTSVSTLLFSGQCQTWAPESELCMLDTGAEISLVPPNFTHTILTRELMVPTILAGYSPDLKHTITEVSLTSFGWTLVRENTPYPIIAPSGLRASGIKCLYSDEMDAYLYYRIRDAKECQVVAYFVRHPEWTKISPTLYWGSFVKINVSYPVVLPPCEFVIKDVTGVYKSRTFPLKQEKPVTLLLSPLSLEGEDGQDEDDDIISEPVQPLPQADLPEQLSSYEVMATDPPRPATMTQLEYHAFLKAVRSYALIGAPSFLTFEQSVKAKLYDHMPKDLNYTTARQVKQFLGDHIARMAGRGLQPPARASVINEDSPFETVGSNVYMDLKEIEGLQFLIWYDRAADYVGVVHLTSKSTAALIIGCKQVILYFKIHGHTIQQVTTDKESNLNSLKSFWQETCGFEPRHSPAYRHQRIIERAIRKLTEMMKVMYSQQLYPLLIKAVPMFIAYAAFLVTLHPTQNTGGNTTPYALFTGCQPDLRYVTNLFGETVMFWNPPDANETEAYPACPDTMGILPPLSTTSATSPRKNIGVFLGPDHLSTPGSGYVLDLRSNRILSRPGPFDVAPTKREFVQLLLLRKGKEQKENVIKKVSSNMKASTLVVPSVKVPVVVQPQSLPTVSDIVALPLPEPVVPEPVLLPDSDIEPLPQPIADLPISVTTGTPGSFLLPSQTTPAIVPRHDIARTILGHRFGKGGLEGRNFQIKMEFLVEWTYRSTNTWVFLKDILHSTAFVQYAEKPTNLFLLPFAQSLTMAMSIDPTVYCQAVLIDSIKAETNPWLDDDQPCSHWPAEYAPQEGHISDEQFLTLQASPDTLPVLTMSVLVFELDDDEVEAAVNQMISSCHQLTLRQAMHQFPEVIVTECITKEIQQLLDMKVVRLPKPGELDRSVQLLRYLCHLEVKHNPTDPTQPDKLKMRGCIDGSGQIDDTAISYSSPTADHTNIMLAMSAAILQKKHFAVADIAGAYLHVPLKDHTHKYALVIAKHMVQYFIQLRPEWASHVRSNGNLVLMLDKALYGLKESAKLFYQHIAAALNKLGFQKGRSDPCLFIKRIGANREVNVLVHVDDLLILADTKEDRRALIDDLQVIYGQLKVQDGENLGYLGLHVNVNRTEGTVTLDCHKYIDNLRLRYPIPASQYDRRPVTPHTGRHVIC